MEKPDGARYSHSVTRDGFEIKIPARRNWFILIFYSIWLCMWTVGGLTALTSLISGIMTKGINEGMLFVSFWLCFWFLGWLYVAFTIVWHLFGNEFITIHLGVMTLKKVSLKSFGEKTYSVSDMKNLKITDASQSMFNFGRSNFNAYIFGQNGLKFDYGQRSIEFGGGLDSAEARGLMVHLEKYMPSAIS